MKYPANPKTNLKDEYEALKKQREEEVEWEKRVADKREEGKKEYLNQLKQLGKSSNVSATTTELDSPKRRGWFSWLGKWRERGGADENSPSVEG